MRKVATQIAAGARKERIVELLRAEDVEDPEAVYGAAVDELRAIGDEDYRVTRGALIFSARQLYGICLENKEYAEARRVLGHMKALLRED